MLLAWKKAGILIYCGYILGFPGDTPESILADIEIIKKELPLDVLQFYFLTPLPGSEDHKVLHERGVPMDPDLNHYDLEHACTAHPIMSKKSWEKVYRDAWARYYTDEHIETVLRRAYASGLPMNKMSGFLTWISGTNAIEKLHPLQFGLLRRKVRRQRRSGLPIESPLVFYPRRVWEAASTTAQWISRFQKYRKMRKRITADLAGKAYMDEALAPVSADAAQDHIVQLYAEQIPNTYGAPKEAKDHVPFIAESMPSAPERTAVPAE
jgi:hypothetical protein